MVQMPYGVTGHAHWAIGMTTQASASAVLGPQVSQHLARAAWFWGPAWLPLHWLVLLSEEKVSHQQLASRWIVIENMTGVWAFVFGICCEPQPLP
jgi:hypothetical protein